MSAFNCLITRDNKKFDHINSLAIYPPFIRGKIRRVFWTIYTSMSYLSLLYT